MELILYAIPFFFLLILLEFGYGVLCGRNTYRLNDTINSLSLGSLSRLQGLVILGFSGALYELVVARWQLAQLPADQLWVWVLCFVLYDFVYYWKHRLGHEVAAFWGAHVAHHQSEDFNLGTALRQTSMDWYGFLFYLPFFVLGFPAEILFTVVSLNLIYQFWVHTEHVPKLGPLEWVFVTPSNHRVHHARNKIYVDRNYGGVFILWDRLFGSFQDELIEEPVVFGLRKPLNSWNPVWANVHVYWRLLRDVARAPGLKHKLLLLVKPPGWEAPGTRTSCKLRQIEPDLTQKFDPPTTRFVRYYAFSQFILTVVCSLMLLVNAPTLSYGGTALAVAYLTYSFYVHGLWLEAQASAVWQECLRLLVFLILLPFAPLSGTLQVSLSLLGFGSVSLVGWLWLRHPRLVEQVGN
jgi:alkylglycerol monooxygenase